MAASSVLPILSGAGDAPSQSDLDKCVHCGLCLNACPTYRELGLEMDSPRGRIYQMNEIANGEPITDSRMLHLDLCLACRGCETACPSGVPYGRLIEAARAQVEAHRKHSILKRIAKCLVFDYLLGSRTALGIAGAALYLYQISGVQRLVRLSGLPYLFERLRNLEALTPNADVPFFYSKLGKSFPAAGERKYRVAFFSGCIANIAFARMNEATVRVLQRNGCEVVVPGGQNCCGALHVHSGLRKQARVLARSNIDAVLTEKFDAVITNAAGCGSTLKEYDELLDHDMAYRDKAIQFSASVKDVTEFLAGIELNGKMGEVNLIATYQDSCHLLHGQKIGAAPRALLRAIPGLTFREMPMSDLCCGSAGIYNVVHNDLATKILQQKMKHVTSTDASLVVTANPGCILQLSAGSRLYGSGQRVMHVVELLDEAYRKMDDERVNAKFLCSA